MGFDWLNRRQLLIRREWMTRFADIITDASRRWDLWLCRDTQVDELCCGASPLKQARLQPGLLKDRLVFQGDVLEAYEIMDTAPSQVSWGEAPRCCIYITDSQALQNVVCGHASLPDERYEELIASVIDRLVNHFACKWTLLTSGTARGLVST